MVGERRFAVLPDEDIEMTGTTSRHVKLMPDGTFVDIKDGADNDQFDRDGDTCRAADEDCKPSDTVKTGPCADFARSD
jgi:hypothetical protein